MLPPEIYVLTASWRPDHHQTEHLQDIGAAAQYRGCLNDREDTLDEHNPCIYADVASGAYPYAPQFGEQRKTSNALTMCTRGVLGNASDWKSWELWYVANTTLSAYLCLFRATIHCMRVSRCAEQALNGRAQGKPYKMLHFGGDFRGQTIFPGSALLHETFRRCTGYTGLCGIIAHKRGRFNSVSYSIMYINIAKRLIAAELRSMIVEQ